MSTVTIIYNILENDWNSYAEYITSNYCNLKIGFEGKDSTVMFDNLSFGYELSANNNIVQQSTFPKDPSIVYRSCPDTILVTEELDLTPNTQFQLDLWVINAGVRSEHRFNFNTPSPTDTGDYPDASVNHPDLENWEQYKFDTNIRQWVKK